MTDPDARRRRDPGGVDGSPLGAPGRDRRGHRRRDSDRRRPRPKLPDPNGYDDLVRAGSMIRGDVARTGATSPGPTSPRSGAFVEANKAALDLARVGLGREMPGPASRNPGRALPSRSRPSADSEAVAGCSRAEAIVAEADGRIADASRSYRDEIALGQAMTQGGMARRPSSAGSLQRPGDRPAPEAPRPAPGGDLPGHPPRPGIARPAAGHRSRPSRPAGPLVSRCLQLGPADDARAGTAIEETERSTEQFQARKAHDQAARAMRFLLVELAIHAHHVDKGTWPRTVARPGPGLPRLGPDRPGHRQAARLPGQPLGRADRRPRLDRPARRRGRRPRP